MRGQRFEEVLRNCREGTPLELTPEEKEHGWHYCPEDQGQLTLQRLVGGKPWCGCNLQSRVPLGCHIGFDMYKGMHLVGHMFYDEDMQGVNFVDDMMRILRSKLERYHAEWMDRT